MNILCGCKAKTRPRSGTAGQISAPHNIKQLITKYIQKFKEKEKK